METLPDATSSPSPEAVRAQLDRILATEGFVNAGRISRLLRYVVERTLLGEGDQLKEYVVGIEVFDRSDSYDPRLDSIVRVEARRLRARLEEYYAGPGNADPVVITIPRGSYVPSLTARQQGGPASTAPVVTPPASRDWSIRSFALLGFFAGVLTVIIVAGAMSRRNGTPIAQASGGPSIAVLLFQHYSASANDAIVAARLTDAVTTELARLGTVSVVSRASMSQYVGATRPAREIARALNAEFLMESTLTVESNKLVVVARLVDGALDRKVWVGEYSAATDQIRELSRRIAAESATAALNYRATH